jgi:hypothetical protein
MNKRTLAVLAAVVMLGAVSAVVARYSYYQMLTKTYPDIRGSRIDYCLCHLNKNDGGGPRNSFGIDFANNNHNLRAIENKDSDNDGFKNIDELKAHTNPGDNADYPKDKTPPKIEIITPERGQVITERKLVVKGKATDDRLVAKIIVKLTGFDERIVSTRNELWETTFELKKNGNYDLTAKAIDSSGNESLEAHIPFSVLIPDDEPPYVQFFFPAEDMVLNSLPIIVSGIASDVSDVTKVEYSVDDRKTWKEAQGTSEWKFTITAIPEGQIFAWVRAWDGLNNVCEPVSQRFRLEFDQVATPTISYPPDGSQIESDSLTVSGTIAPPAVKVGIVLDDGQELWAEVERSFWSIDLGKIKVGRHTVTACAYDQINRKSEVCAMTEFEYVVHDATPPVITIKNVKEGDHFELGELKIEGSAKDDISGLDKVEISIDGKTWQSETSENFSFSFTFDVAGDYQIFIRATDKAGNFSAMPVVINITILPKAKLTIDQPDKALLETGNLSVYVYLSRKSMPEPVIKLSGNTKEFTISKVRELTYKVEALLGAGQTTIQATSGELMEKLDVSYKVKIEFTLNKKVMTVNGSNTEIKVAPLLISGRTFIPFRVIGDALHAKVEWDAETRTATYVLGDNSYSLVVGSTNAYVNGKPIPVSTAPQIIKGSLMIPIRVFSDILGGTIDYDNATKRITLVYPKLI